MSATPESVAPASPAEIAVTESPVSYTHLTLPTMSLVCRSRWSPYH